MSFDHEERQAQLEDDGGPVLRTSRPSYREIPRSLEEVGFARHRGAYKCRDRAGYWRTRHEHDPRDKDERCIYCGRPSTATRIQAA